MSLSGKTLFITGASRGIGREIALRAALSSSGRSITGRLLIDEQLLAEQGQTGFEHYRYDPQGGPLIPDLFVD